jgi:hypothetical protein
MLRTSIEFARIVQQLQAAFETLGAF